MTQGNPSPIPRAPFMQNQTDSMCRGDIFHILYVLSENSEWLLHFSTSGYSQSDIIDMPALMKIHLKSY